MPAPVTRDLEVLTDLQGRFLRSIADADPAAPVPWCGRWRVRQLVIHLARIHHWAAAQARSTREVPLGRGPFDLRELYARCAHELRSALTELDPAARAHTLLDDGVARDERTGTVSFWHRRQKLETLVHLWDLRTATGRDLVVDEETWWDCVREVADVMHPRQVRLGRTGPPPLLLTLQRPDGTATVLDGGVESMPGTPRLTVTGSAEDLALLLWGRRTVAAPGLVVTATPPCDDGAALPADPGAAVADLLAGPLTP